MSSFNTTLLKVSFQDR